jgi:hypothetical protein
MGARMSDTFFVPPDLWPALLKADQVDVAGILDVIDTRRGFEELLSARARRPCGAFRADPGRGTALVTVDDLGLRR